MCFLPLGFLSLAPLCVMVQSAGEPKERLLICISDLILMCFSHLCFSRSFTLSLCSSIHAEQSRWTASSNDSQICLSNNTDVVTRDVI